MPDDSTTPTPPAPKPANKLVVERATNFQWLYANSAVFEGNAWDLKITFGQIEKHPDGTGGTLIKEQVAVSIPYAQAKLAVYWLQAQVLAYELEAGKIAIRRDQLPPPPPEPTLEQQQKTPGAQQFHERVVKMRDEFLASLA